MNMTSEEVRLREALRQTEEALFQTREALKEALIQVQQYEKKIKKLEQRHKATIKHNGCLKCKKRARTAAASTKSSKELLGSSTAPGHRPQIPRAKTQKLVAFCSRCQEEPVIGANLDQIYHEDAVCKKCAVSGSEYWSEYGDGLEHSERDIEVLHEETVRGTVRTKKVAEREEIDDVPFVPGPQVDPFTVDHVCQHCGKSFAKRTSLLQHERIHGFKNHACDLCGKEFASKKIQQRHVKMIHMKETQNKYSCDICKKTFTYPQNLKTHKQSQQHYSNPAEIIPSKPLPRFDCPMCQKTFKVKSNLQDHIRTHTKEKPFKCSYCSKKFCQSSQQKKHERTHSGEKPFKCQLCSKAFTAGCNLKRHLIAHNGHKNYICVTCGKAYTQKWNLKNHELSHENKVKKEVKGEPPVVTVTLQSILENAESGTIEFQIAQVMEQELHCVQLTK